MSLSTVLLAAREKKRGRGERIRSDESMDSDGTAEGHRRSGEKRRGGGEDVHRGVADR